MLLTNREKTIMELLIKTSGRHTTLSIASYLQVSVRTVMRDLKKIEKTLDQFGLRLEQGDNNSLRVAGSDQSVYQLVQVLSQVKPLDLSTRERKLLLLLQLMQVDEPIKTGPLAKDLGISVVTLITQLDELTEWLQDFDVNLLRKRGVGIQLAGTESAKRKALENFYLLYFNEELIEAIFQADEPVVAQEHLILHFFKPDYLVKINRIIKKYIGKMYAELADSDYVGFLVQVCISCQRFESGWLLSEADRVDNSWSEKAEAFPIIAQITADVSDELSIILDENEKAFLAMVLKGSRLQNAESIYYDRVITGKTVKKLIQHVSKELNIDLTQDFSLFQGLLAHLEPSLFRIRKKMVALNPLTEQVKTQFPALFAIVAECLDYAFPDIHFPEDEVAYIVLHFGSALEQRREVTRLNALVVCPTGIGASKMLATLLKKKLPELASVSVSSIGDMGKMDLKPFDVILTTVHLPKQPLPCILVNPLLSRENIKEIREVTRKLLQQRPVPELFTGQQKLQSAQAVQDRPLTEFMDQTERSIQLIRQLLQDFEVLPVRDAKSVTELLQRTMQLASRKAMIGDPERIVGKLLKRQQVAGLAIPETNMALFHCLDESVDHISFLIAHTGTAFKLRGMDGKSQMTTNFLILLAPSPMDPLEQEIISTVSSALVEDQESILIFASANEKIIRTKLENNFFQFLTQKFSKD
ncbi:MAG: transcription antiterminator [Sporolactobacillus sp.]